MNLAITGPTSGIGEIAFKRLLPHFDQIFLLARSEKKAKELISKLNPEEKRKSIFIPCDLASMDSVVKAAGLIKSETEKLDVLLNNAGGIFQEKELTEDGFELTLSANHLGHFLLTEKLMPLLLKAEKPKVVMVSSEAHRAAKVDFDDLNYEKKGYSSFNAYANVKLFNILFSKSLVDKYGKEGLSSYSLHPGVVKTNFGIETSGIFKLFWKLATPFMVSPEKGAETSIYLTKTKIEESLNGYYFKNKKVTKPSKEALSTKMRERLWEKSEEYLSKWLK